MTPKPQANKTELEIQIADIFWVFGRRGFTDTESVDDSVRKTVYAITQAMLDMPELQSEWEEDIHGTPNPNGIARNELREQIRTAINSKGG